MNEIELINQQLADLEKQIQLKRQEAIKAKLKYIKENGVAEISMLTEQEQEQLSYYLSLNGSPTSTLIEHVWSHALYPEDQMYDFDEYNTYVKLGENLYSISSNKFINPEQLGEEYNDDSMEDYSGYSGLEYVLGNKDSITEELNIDTLFDTTRTTTIENEQEENLEEEQEYDEHEEYADYDSHYRDTEPYEEDVIYNILRNRIVDYNANAMFGENNNFCEIGQYSDMGGEEQIAATLNSMSQETLKKYFEGAPEDYALFEQMRSKYPDIQKLDFEIQEPKTPRQLFEDSLIREDVAEYYLSKTPEELLESFGPEVARMVGFEQKNSHHCYDLWEHTLRTVEGIKSENLTPEQFKKLRVAAFFHDIGKPEVAQFNEKTGQQVFYGHATHSVDVAKPILSKLGYTEAEIEQLGFYIGHHDDFISYKSNLPQYMQNHEFVRGIDDKTVAEKMIENKFNFEAMGYNKDQIRVICYTLAHNEEPHFIMQNKPVNVTVNMEKFQKKIDSEQFNAKYQASQEDYQMLIQLCKADAGAQSEKAMQMGKDGNMIQVGSKDEKLENMTRIEQNIPEAYKEAQEKSMTSNQKFYARIASSATRRVEVREKNEQAKDLYEKYEGQMPSRKGPSIDD